MKKALRFIMFFCFGLLFSGSSTNAFAWGGDITLPATAGYRYTDARISVAYEGTIYYARRFATTPTGPVTNWELMKSTDNGITFIFVTGGSLGGTNKCTAVDLICAGENATDFAVYVGRAYLDTISTAAALYVDKYNAAGTYVGSPISENYTYSMYRGWLNLSFATDSRDKNAYSSPYAISLAAAKASPYDSVIVWTSNNGGSTIVRRGLYGTAGFVGKVSASIGSVITSTSGYGRLGVAWDNYDNLNDVWGAVKFMIIYPDDATNSIYPGPFEIQSGALNYRNPCMIISQNTTGGTGPGTSDYRAIIAMEYNSSGNVWGAVFDSIVLKSPTYTWSNISAGSPAGVSSQAHGVFDPMYDNFLFTYYNDDANGLPYVVKPMGSPATDDAYVFQANYRDLSGLSAVPMHPRVDMSISRGNAAFAWNDNANSMFDAEWSTVVGVSENTSGVTGLNLYPNPASDIANISFVAAEAQDIDIRIIDMTGRVFISESYSAAQGSNLVPVVIRDLAAGNYIISLSGNTVNSFLSMVVTR